jgi:anti-anti-sigma regulatory factor
MFIVKLYDMFCTDTLRHRDTARKVVATFAKEPVTAQVTIDFDKIDFASRSFLHELLSDLGSRKVVFENRNEEVKQMMEIARKGTISTVC